MEIAQQKPCFTISERVDQAIPQGVIVTLLAIGERLAPFVGKIPFRQQRDFDLHRLPIEGGNLIGAAINHRQQVGSRGLMEGCEAGNALQITFFYRRSLGRKHPVAPQILQQENALIDIRCQKLWRAKAAVS